MNPVVVLIFAQLLFGASDLLGRWYMSRHGFSATTLISLPILGYFAIRTVATVMQLYVFTHIDLGKTIALFGITSIVLANVLGFLFLKEILTAWEYIGIFIGIAAFLILAVK